MERSQFILAKYNVIALHEIARQLDSIGLFMSAIDIRVMADTLDKELEDIKSSQPHVLINKS